VRATRWLVAAALAVGGYLLTVAASARPLERPHGPAFYWVHGGATAAGFGLGWSLVRITEDLDPNCDLGSFGPDDAVRPSFSPSASSLSDRLLWVSVTLPLAAQMSNGFDPAFGNAALIYTETLSANYLLFATAKSLVRRPRPYTHAREADIVEFSESQGSESFRSFYSGHSSSAFAGAMAGSILYAARTDEPWARHVMWGLEFGLAGLVARLRVTAGFHYRTDVWVGTLAGAGLGLVIPALHRVEFDRIRPSEWAVAGGATVLTLAVSELVNLCHLLGPDSLCTEQSYSLRQKTQASRVRWGVMPAGFDGAGGLAVVGVF
jgi:membrane-associated phospholipid phosphatase